MTLRDWRRRRAISIEDLAASSGVSTKTIVQIEHGRQVPRFKTIRQLSAALGIEPQDVAEFVPVVGSAHGRQAEVGTLDARHDNAGAAAEPTGAGVTGQRIRSN